jgi:homeobox protein cut-like
LNSVQWTKLPCPSPTNNHSLEPLDTTYVSNIVRKILAQHNIGQRVFARCILSLSQGTVSELLSKPKPWAKLTEKGKESYRKMWSWANSEESILTLKSISPRKGMNALISNTEFILSVGSKENTQQKSVQILSEPLLSKTSRTPSTSSTSSRTVSPSSEQPSFIPPSMFSAFVPSLLMQTTNRLKNESYPPYNILCSQPENYRNWLMLQEIVRNNALIKQLKPLDNEENEQENDDDDDEIPLDLSMKIDSDQSSTNKSSLIKSNKAILPPLTEQDLSKYRSINTLELVQAIKDILSRFSISQRHFGEKILGLSQGSVSDILARPKSWESLTQKGREPFIRMRLFLDDSNAMKQLVQSVALTSSSLSPLNNGFQTNNFLSNENSIDEQSNDFSHVLSNESLSSSSVNGTTNNNNKSKSRPKNNNNKDPPRIQLTKKSQMVPYELPKISLPSK